MEEAIKAMEKCDGKVKVGAVLVVDGEVVAVGSKMGGTHAERSAIEAARERGLNLKRAALYTTLEPCVDINTGQRRQCCADLIVSEGIPEVIIGRYDPNPNVYRKGWKRLRDGGVRLRDFPMDLRNSIDAINDKFMDFFSSGIGPSGGAKIDHKEPAKFRIQFSADDNRYMEIGWTLCGINAAYGSAVDPVKVALARFASNFDEVDDPTAYEFGHSARIAVGEVGVFVGPEACVLVKPKEIQSGPDYGAENHFVKFDYVVRIIKPRSHSLK
ncbi:deaminase [Azohydromonas lata]|uniref:deaminase n=1 Tax=Azohydromonas lata TaxID=45677 RepID=UPI001471D5B7|nr:deaminase [Azohydromonas lata]